jgi:hypothetical protein
MLSCWGEDLPKPATPLPLATEHENDGECEDGEVAESASYLLHGQGRERAL